MKVLILAAGYGTRLYPLTKNIPKPLLPIGERTLLDCLVKKIDKLKSMTETILVTNEKFFGVFQDWKEQRKDFSHPVTIVNDATTTPENRLGAMGDVQLVLKQYRPKEDLLVIGGDNLFDETLEAFLSFALAKKPKVTIGVYDIRSQERAKTFGVVQMDSQNRVTAFFEKPSQPPSTLIAMCLYFFPMETLPYVAEYLNQTKSSDTTGDYIHWILGKDVIYGFKFGGKWYDIGSIEAYHEAQREFK